VPGVSGVCRGDMGAVGAWVWMVGECHGAREEGASEGVRMYTELGGSEMAKECGDHSECRCSRKAKTGACAESARGFGRAENIMKDEERTRRFHLRSVAVALVLAIVQI
jgi:hypothetical protein